MGQTRLIDPSALEGMRFLQGARRRVFPHIIHFTNLSWNKSLLPTKKKLQNSDGQC